MLARMNVAVAARLAEVADLLEQQGAGPFRVRAYRQAADTVRALPQPLRDLVAAGDVSALERLPGIGPSIARSIGMLLSRGRLPMLDRLRGDSDAVALFTTVPGIGRVLAERLHYDAGLDSLEELEVAAHNGRLARLPRFGPRRVAAVREALAARLARVRPADSPAEPAPLVDEILSVDREYRTKAAAGELPRISPRRFNPERVAWLPVLHTARGSRQYTALFSNTARAHELGRTHDWVVIYVDGGRAERQYTVVTARLGPLKGKRVVRGREAECRTYYRGSAVEGLLAHADSHA